MDMRFTPRVSGSTMIMTPLSARGAVEPPVSLTSTFVLPAAEEGRDFFDYVAGRKEPPPEQGRGLI